MWSPRITSKGVAYIPEWLSTSLTLHSLRRQTCIPSLFLLAAAADGVELAHCCLDSSFL